PKAGRYTCTWIYQGSQQLFSCQLIAYVTQIRANFGSLASHSVAAGTLGCIVPVKHLLTSLGITALQGGTVCGNGVILRLGILELFYLFMHILGVALLNSVNQV